MKPTRSPVPRRIQCLPQLLVISYPNTYFVDNGFRMIASNTRSRSPAGTANDSASTACEVRPATLKDLGQVIAIDTEATGIEKVDYWYELFHRYGSRTLKQRFFLVAADGQQIVGFIIGEVRDWEFGSPPCGWVFGLGVKSSARLGGVATMMLDAICAGFARSGVKKVRTLLSRDNELVMSFFRSQGMVAAPVIALEMNL